MAATTMQDVTSIGTDENPPAEGGAAVASGGGGCRGAGPCAPLAWLYQRVLLPTDTATDMLRKQYAVLCLSLSLSIGSFILFMAMLNGIFFDFFWWALMALILVGGALPPFVYLQVTKTIPVEMFFAWLVGTGVAVFARDVDSQRYMSTPHWVFMVLLLDLSLVLEFPDWMSKAIIATGFVWVFLFELQMTVDTGIFVDPWAANATDFYPPACECATPPCQWREWFPATFGACTLCLILICDYYFTRGFARALRDEKLMMAASIDTAHQIAVCLSAFDLESAEELLACGQHALPVELENALTAILGNLKTYKPYLPLSCLPAPEMPSDPAPHEGGGVDDRRGSAYSSTGVASEAESTGCASEASSVAMSNTVSNASSFRMAPLPARSFRMTTSPRNRSPMNRSPRMSRSGVGSSGAPAPAPRPRPRSAPATLLVTNLHQTSTWGRDAGTVESVISTMLQATVGTLDRYRAMLDVFLGDRLLVSFNTSRPCLTHATSAVNAAKAYYTRMHEVCVSAGKVPGINIAIATGRVMCGDLGSDTIRRYTVLGDLPPQVWAWERMGRRLQLDIVCNDATAADAGVSHELMRVERNFAFVRTARNGDDDPASYAPTIHALYVVVIAAPKAPDNDDSGARGPDEWMYELLQGAARQWEAYNEAMGMYLQGRPMQAALTHAEGTPKEDMLRDLLLSDVDRTPLQVML